MEEHPERRPGPYSLHAEPLTPALLVRLPVKRDTTRLGEGTKHEADPAPTGRAGGRAPGPPAAGGLQSWQHRPELLPEQEVGGVGGELPGESLQPNRQDWRYQHLPTFARLPQDSQGDTLAPNALRLFYSSRPVLPGHLLTMSRRLRHEASLPERLWGEALVPDLGSI